MTEGVGHVFNLGRAFRAVARLHGDRAALRYGSDRTVSYQALAESAERIAAGLATRGIGRGHIVAIQNGKSFDGYAALLGVLLAGAAYTHLDPTNPAGRLARILRICRPKLLLADGAIAPGPKEAAASLGLPVVQVADLVADAANASAPVQEPIGSDPAYIMFTSGSTGQPKGVAIAHASVLAFVGWCNATFEVGPGAVVANANPIFFDNSVFDVYAALFTGATLAPLTSSEIADAATLTRRVEEMGCTLWFSVPSLLIFLMTMKAMRGDAFGSVRTIVFGGEGFPRSELAKLHAFCGHRCRLVNVYGPTEGTCICSAYDITAADLVDRSGLPPLGRIADNFSWAILDGDAPVAPGEVGELCLGGPQLALGYYNDSDRTAASFVADPLATMLPGRIYRTGDLVREEAGLLHFVGRRDNQIKHMGYRIELEEIEAALAGLGGVVQAAVVYQRRRVQLGHIVAFVTGPGARNPALLRDRLAGILPAYMLPSRIVAMDTLPKNANGKVDRVALAALEG